MSGISGISGVDGVSGSYRTTINTDRPDQEVRDLRQLRDTLEQRLQRAGDPSIRDNLQKRLAQVEKELQSKDTDGYRRQRSKVTSEKV